MSVVDETEAPLANATVIVTRLAQTASSPAGQRYDGTTDAEGGRCIALSEGDFSVEVSLTGFLSVRYRPVRVIYPYVRKLNYRLPIGGTGEGGVDAKATLAGILVLDGKPIQNADIGILRFADAAIVTRGRSNEFGEYALVVAPGTYRVEIRIATGSVYRSVLTVLRPGYQHNAISLGDKVSNQ